MCPVVRVRTREIRGVQICMITEENIRNDTCTRTFIPRPPPRLPPVAYSIPSSCITLTISCASDKSLCSPNRQSSSKSERESRRTRSGSPGPPARSHRDPGTVRRCGGRRSARAQAGTGRGLARCRVHHTSGPRLREGVGSAGVLSERRERNSLRHRLTVVSFCLRAGLVRATEGERGKTYVGDGHELLRDGFARRHESVAESVASPQEVKQDLRTPIQFVHSPPPTTNAPAVPPARSPRRP
mgnify:CR=1 FL=1